MISLEIHLNSSHHLIAPPSRCHDWCLFVGVFYPNDETEEHLVTFESNLNALDSFFNVACLYVVSRGNAIQSANNILIRI